MTTKELADRLVELCRKGDFESAQAELFADDVISIEPHATPDFQKETKGKQAVKEKGDKWNDMVETTHNMEVSGTIDCCLIHIHLHNAYACKYERRKRYGYDGALCLPG